MTGPEKEIALSIIKHGDQAGKATETLVELVAQRQGLASLGGSKYESNNGFDHVFVDAEGGVTILMDSKQYSGGAAQLGGGAGSVQLSDAWIYSVLTKLPANSPAASAVRKAMLQGSLTTAVAGVDRSTGKLTIFSIAKKE